MNRREAIKLAGLGASGLMFPYVMRAMSSFSDEEGLQRSHFGEDFLWGVATAAYQIEGARNEDGKSDSIWDVFADGRGNIKTRENANVACDFYHRYATDLDLVKELNFGVFRFSTAWTRIMPDGKVNQKGIDFYQRVVDACLERGISPWITLYHWDLPQSLQQAGGWRNRAVVDWFTKYADVVTRAYGDRVKNWMVLNEPVAFTVLGYFLGMHAPGKLGLKSFLPTVHHTALAQAEGGRIIRANVKEAHVGTTFSCSSVHGYRPDTADEKTAKRLDALMNRLYIEPAVGKGYPIDGFPQLRKLERYIKPGDIERLPFDFDFIGIQNYTRIVARHMWYVPYVKGNQVHPAKRNVPITEMEWEVYPKGIYEQLKRFSGYPGVKKIIVTENGAAFEDQVEQGRVHDEKRTQFYHEYLKEVLRAKRDGVPVAGYFCWTLLDNFEWAEGFRPRFGLVHTNFETQERIIKDSGLWFKGFLSK